MKLILVKSKLDQNTDLFPAFVVPFLPLKMKI